MKLLFAICIMSILLLSGHAFQYWTRWLNRDNPGLTGDWELYSAFKTAPCRSGFKPVSADCRLLRNNKIWYLENEVISHGHGCFQCTPKGFVCLNIHQPDRRCHDYKIRFLCYKPSNVKG